MSFANFARLRLQTVSGARTWFPVSPRELCNFVPERLEQI